MNVLTSLNVRLFAFYLVLVIFACSPVWGVEYFINQDGSPHVYNGYLMTELLKGNSFVAEHFALNPIPLPNSSGHWIIVLLLALFSPFVVTKVVVTLTFATFVAAIGWLRYKTAGHDGLKTSLLIGAALAFNWMWLIGFYNFVIGVTGFIFTTGLYYAWREKITAFRAVLLSLFVLIVYLSHVVGFAALGGALGVLAVTSGNIKRNVLWLIAVCLPVLPLIILFRLAGESAGGFSPHWRLLSDPLSLSNWVSQAISSDAFILISRKTLPFTAIQSSWLALLAPTLWIFLALLLLTIGSFVNQSRTFLLQKETLPFTMLSIFSLAAMVLVPDDFGLSNGSILRPRLLLCGICFFVPLFRSGTSVFLKRAAQACLIFVIVFQTMALWEFAMRSDTVAREFLAAGPSIEENEGVAAVTLVEDGLRFHAFPETQAVTLLGLNRNILLWDNYELGYYLFPIGTRNLADRKFIYDLTTSHGFILNDAADIAEFDKRLALLDTTLQENNQKIGKLVVWGRDGRVDAVLRKWFSDTPIFEGGRVRVFRHN